MSQPRVITPAPLCADAFAPFGDVLSIDAAVHTHTINYGQTLRFESAAVPDLSAQGGAPALSIFRSTPLPAPLTIKVMERHPLSSQAFYPLSNRPYLVVVAPKGVFDAAHIRAFLAAPDQGVNYHTGTWHHYLLALDAPSDFLVIDRTGPGPDCDEVHLQDKIIVDIPS